MRDPYHVVPIGDLREHEVSEDCWCGPDYDDIVTAEQRAALRRFVDQFDVADMVEDAP